jgi:hypothetical protein
MTKNNGKNQFNNFAVLTAEISNVQNKKSGAGKEYKTASATLTGITYKGEDGLLYSPVIEVLVFGPAGKYLTAGPKMLTGSLSYSERKGENNAVIRQLKLIATTVKPITDGKERTFVRLTVRVGKEVETRLSGTTSLPYTNIRASLSMGKDDNDHYRPSLWLSLKAFSGKNGEHSDFVYTLGNLDAGDYIDVDGGLTVEEYKGEFWWGVYLRTLGVEYHDFGDGSHKSLNTIEEEIEQEKSRILEAIPD